MLALLLPIIISAVVLFFASFLSWMVVALHRQDWVKLEKEDEFIKAVSELNITRGSYMFPCCENPEEMKSEAFKQKWESGPCGILTVFPKVNMGKNLGLTFAYFLVVSFCIAYLTTLAHQPGAEFAEIFRFVATAGFLVFLSAIVQHAIWFHSRIVGHVIESVAYAALIGVIFGLMWPGAS